MEYQSISTQMPFFEHLQVKTCHILWTTILTLAIVNSWTSVIYRHHLNGLQTLPASSLSTLKKLTIWVHLDYDYIDAKDDSISVENTRIWCLSHQLSGGCRGLLSRSMKLTNQLTTTRPGRRQQHHSRPYGRLATVTVLHPTRNRTLWCLLVGRSVGSWKWLKRWQQL